MKRTNLVLDDKNLKEVCLILGERTYSGAVNRALEEIIRLARVRKLADFFGSDLWEGDLSQMREDRSRRKRPLSKK